MTFDEFCKEIFDEHGFYICDESNYIDYLEKNVPCYRTIDEDFNQWYFWYEESF